MGQTAAWSDFVFFLAHHATFAEPLDVTFCGLLSHSRL